MGNCVACEAILQPEWDVCLICGHDPSAPAPEVAPDPATLVPAPGALDQVMARPVLVAGVVGAAILVVALVGALLVGGSSDESAVPPQLGFVDRGNQAGAAFCRDGELAIRAVPPAAQSDFRSTVVFWENENGGWERLGADLAPEGLTAEAGALVEQVACLTLVEGPVDGELCSWQGEGQVLVQDATWRATMRRAIDGTIQGGPVDIASISGCSIAELTATGGALSVRAPRPAMDDLAAFLTPWVGTGEVERLQAERAARGRVWGQLAPACGAEHALIPGAAPWAAGFGTLIAVAEATSSAPHSTSSTPAADGAVPDFWRATLDNALDVELVFCVTPAADFEVVVTPAVCPAVPAGGDEVAPMVEVSLLTRAVDVRLFVARSGEVLFEHRYPATSEPGCPDPADVVVAAGTSDPEGPLQVWVPSPLPGPELVESLVGFVEG